MGGDKINILSKIKQTITKRIERFNQLYEFGYTEFCKDYLTGDDPNIESHCSKCGKFLGNMEILRQSKKVEIGKTYKVKCRRCGHENKRLKKEIDHEKRLKEAKDEFNKWVK